VHAGGWNKQFDGGAQEKKVDHTCSSFLNLTGTGCHTRYLPKARLPVCVVTWRGHAMPGNVSWPRCIFVLLQIIAQFSHHESFVDHCGGRGVWRCRATSDQDLCYFQAQCADATVRRGRGYSPGWQGRITPFARVVWAFKSFSNIDLVSTSCRLTVDNNLTMNLTPPPPRPRLSVLTASCIATKATHGAVRIPLMYPSFPNRKSF
jgi:hypothetical protein